VTIVVHVARVRPHPRHGLRPLGEGDRALERRLRERAVAVVHEEEGGRRVVRHEQVGPAVVVEVGDADSHPLSDVGSDTGSHGDVGEGAVPVVVVERPGQPLVFLGMAVVERLRLPAARLLVRVPDDVVRNVEVEGAIPVVVEECGGHRP
jgi:hypothetical protein